MKSLKKLIEAIKLFCSCKSTCIVGDEVRITAALDKDSSTILRISYI